MRAEDIREFMSRDWSLVERLTRTHRAQRHRELGPAQSLRIAALLYEHVRRMRPDWPSADSRRADLEHHIELSEQLRAIRR